MPAPTTCAELLELIRKSGLIPLSRLDSFINQVEASSSAKTPRQLSELLIAAGIITQFQAEQFQQGKWRGFTIGKYKVLERLGSGGMGTVYLCEHTVVGRKVAIKVLPTAHADNPASLGRFYREARASGILDHPNLVRAHDIDEEGGLHFLVMDYVDGSSLQDIVTRFGPLSIDRAIDYIRQAAQGLQHAHTCGLVHRDIKPANILLERNGTIRVLDLGLARFYHDNTDPLTLKYDDKSVLGTADYVAPEQALDSHEVDIRADIYSLGATFYFLLTGQTLFGPGKMAQKLIWHQVRQPTPVQKLRPEVPLAVSDILQKMLAKNPAHRYQTPQEVVLALEVLTPDFVPLPSDEEMPQLSPATATHKPSVSPNKGQRPITPSRPDISVDTPPGRKSRLSRPVRPSVSSGKVVTLNRMTAPSEQATPRNLSELTPNATINPRPELVRAPSQLLQQNQPSQSSTVSSRTQFLRLGLLILVSSLMGMALTWWLKQR